MTQVSSDLQPEWGLTTFDPWDTRITNENIWPIYRAMREQAPAVHSDALGGFWSITRYQEVRAVALDHRGFSSRHALEIGKQNWTENRPRARLIETDAPDHTRYRKVMQAPILQKKMSGFSDSIRASVRQLLARIGDLKEFDIVTDLAEPIPQEVLADILGFDQETRIRNRDLVLKFVHADLSTSEATHKDFWNFLNEVIEQRLRNPGDDFLSQLCVAEVDGERFTPTELSGMLHGFALAGHHTAIDGISSMVKYAANENVKSSFFADPSVGPQIVEETLRCDPPIHLEGRTTTADVVVGGVKIPAGESVALLYASANHDELQFENPEIFDINRSPNQHVAFGYGVHMCIGLHLARLEMNTILDELLNTFPSYRLTEEPVHTGMVFGHHMGWESMPAIIS